MGRIAAVVLAAGRGTRMKSDLPKVLHPVAGVPMIRHVVDAVASAGVADVVVVVGPDGAPVREVLGAACRFAVQAAPRGTGDAVRAALAELGDAERVLVVNGDAPLLTGEVLRALLEAHGAQGAGREGGPAPAATLASAELEDASGYGRVVRGEGSEVLRIVEEADCSPEERRIREVYSGIACFEAEALRKALPRLESRNAQGELYLTDVPAILRSEGLRTVAWLAPDSEAVLGVNDRVELARAAAVLRRRRLLALMREGVSVVDPETTYVDASVEVGRDSVIQPFSILEGATRVGKGCVIGPGTHLVDAAVGDGARVVRSMVEGSEIGAGARVGPFSHIRPGSVVGEEAEVGNFAELKATSLGRGAKAHHHSYLGDAEIGERVNVGAGVVTVNFDGRAKHRTVVGDDAFLGCNANIIAPLRIGEGAWVAAGSTLTDDVPKDALAIARERQTNKDGWARRRRP